MKRMQATLAGLLLSAQAIAAPVTVTFDDPVANYTPTPGVAQDVTDEFAPLGFIFQDANNPAFGATLGRCGPGDGPVSLFGHGADFGGCGDTTPNLNILFVDPSNSSNRAFTTSFSIFNFDGLIKMTAYDINDVELGSTQLFNGLLSLSGIGQIARINLVSLDQDPTTMDTMTFEAVTPITVPEPASFALVALGAVGMAFTRRRRLIGH